MKKSLALLMVLVLMVAMLAGCGTSTEKDESVVIYQNKVEIGEQLMAFAAL